MAYDPISASQVDSNSPLDTVLFGSGINNNLIDHETRILANEGSLASLSAGAGASYDKALAGEDIDTTTNPKSICLSTKNCLAIEADDSYLDVKEAGDEVSVQIISADANYLIYDLDTPATHTALAFDLCRQIETSLNASALTQTYDVTYSSTTRKITISPSGTATIMVKTGTHGYHNATTGLWNALQFRQKITINATNKHIDFDEGGGELTATLTEADYYENDDNFATLATEIKTRLDAAGADIYTPVYDSGTDKWTITSDDSWTWLLKTGTNTATNAGTYLGYDDSADTSAGAAHVADNSPPDYSGTSFTADYVIDSSDNDSYVPKTFVTKTDSALVVKSRNYDGFVSSSAAKMSFPTVDQFTEIGFSGSGLTAGKRYYTTNSAITFDATNQDIDYKEGAGGELNVVITAATYYRGSDADIGYRILCADIKAVMEAGGALTYTVTFNKDTNLFQIAASGACTLLFKTGTNGSDNLDTSPATTLGYNTLVDTSSATSHAATTAQDLVGEVVVASSAGEHSVYAGKSLNKGRLFSEKNYTSSNYDPIYQTPGDWLTTPTEKDEGEEIQFCDQHENASGVGCRIYVSTTSPADYYFQFKTGPGLVWQDATTTFSAGTPGNAAITENFGGAYIQRSRVFVDEDGSMVAALFRKDTASGWHEAWTAYSTDGGDNWTMGNANASIHSGGNNIFIAGIYARANKAVILSRHGGWAETQIHISNDSGSGYATWASTTIDNDYNNYSCGVLIQYRSASAGVNQYTIYTFGTKAGDGELYYSAFDGDGANETSAALTGANNGNLIGACLDSAGLGNKILVASTRARASAHIDTFLFDDAEVASVSVASTGDAQGGAGSNPDGYNGYSSSSSEHLGWNETKRCVLYNNYGYIVAQTDANAGGKKQLGLFTSKNVSGGSWEAKVSIGGGGNNQECCMVYISSIHSFLVIYKYMVSAAVANNLTNGIINSRLFEINGDGSYSAHATERIDGGETEAGFQGFVTVSASADGASVSWENYDGAARDTLWGNNFI